MADRALSCVLAAALVLAFAPLAFGQGGVATGPGQVDTAFKTPPLLDSDTILIPLDMHPTTAMGAPWLGWGGALMNLHLADPTEVDVLAGSNPAGGITTLPFGPPSAGVASSSVRFTFFHPAVFGSGIPLTPSVNQPIFTLSLHAKNTLPINNGDFDLTASFANIWHVIGGTAFASQVVLLDPSAYVFVTSNITNTGQLHTTNSLVEWNPATPGTGHWLHVDLPLTFHLTGGPGSNIFATFVNTAKIGIQHVPEPTSAALLGLGLGALALSRRVAARRRRLG
jgi:hypothetical protein